MNILNVIDNIDDVSFDAEADVMCSLMESYTKALDVIDSVDESSLDSFEIFNESFIMEGKKDKEEESTFRPVVDEKTGKKENIAKSILLAFPRLLMMIFKAISKAVCGKDGNAKVDKKKIKDALDVMTDEELEEIEQGLNKKHKTKFGLAFNKAHDIVCNNHIKTAVGMVLPALSLIKTIDAHVAKHPETQFEEGTLKKWLKEVKAIVSKDKSGKEVGIVLSTTHALADLTDITAKSTASIRSIMPKVVEALNKSLSHELDKKHADEGTTNRIALLRNISVGINTISQNILVASSLINKVTSFADKRLNPVQYNQNEYRLATNMAIRDQQIIDFCKNHIPGVKKATDAVWNNGLKVLGKAITLNHMPNITTQYNNDSLDVDGLYITYGNDNKKRMKLYPAEFTNDADNKKKAEELQKNIYKENLLEATKDVIAFVGDEYDSKSDADKVATLKQIKTSFDKNVDDSLTAWINSINAQGSGGAIDTIITHAKFQLKKHDDVVISPSEVE